VRELDEPPDPYGRIRRPGGGPKRLRDTDPGLVEALDRLVDPDTRGDPASPLRWTCKSTRELAEALTAQGHPVSDDTVGKKELVGNFANGGAEWQPSGEPVEVDVHDFPDPALGKAIPYGVYDLGRNTGWVSVGVDHDTAAFAVATLRRWWEQVGGCTPRRPGC
jgi:Rhodopirellula transposase DDE domain